MKPEALAASFGGGTRPAKGKKIKGFTRVTAEVGKLKLKLDIPDAQWKKLTSIALSKDELKVKLVEAGEYLKALRDGHFHDKNWPAVDELITLIESL